MKTAENIITALADPQIPMTNDQVRTAWDLLKQRHNRLQQETVLAFRIGDKVSFDGKGEKKNGTVTKINQKSVGVRVMESYGPVNWKVAPSFLTKVN